MEGIGTLAHILGVLLAVGFAVIYIGFIAALLWPKEMPDPDVPPLRPPREG